MRLENKSVIKMNEPPCIIIVLTEMMMHRKKQIWNMH